MEAAQHEETETRIDLANTRNRMFEATNYSVAISVGLVGAIQLFANDDVAYSPFGELVVWTLLGNAIASSVASFSSVWSLTRFRFRLKRVRIEQSKSADSVWKKTVRDVPIWMILLAVSYGAIGFALLYLDRRVGVEFLPLP